MTIDFFSLPIQFQHSCLEKASLPSFVRFQKASKESHFIANLLRFKFTINASSAELIGQRVKLRLPGNGDLPKCLRIPFSAFLENVRFEVSSFIYKHREKEYKNNSYKNFVNWLKRVNFKCDKITFWCDLRPSDESIIRDIVSLSGVTKMHGIKDAHIEKKYFYFPQITEICLWYMATDETLVELLNLRMKRITSFYTFVTPEGYKQFLNELSTHRHKIDHFSIVVRHTLTPSDDALVLSGFNYSKRVSKIDEHYRTYDLFLKTFNWTLVIGSHGPSCSILTLKILD